MFLLRLYAVEISQNLKTASKKKNYDVGQRERIASERITVIAMILAAAIAITLTIVTTPAAAAAAGPQPITAAMPGMTLKCTMYIKSIRLVIFWSLFIFYFSCFSPYMKLIQ